MTTAVKKIKTFHIGAVSEPVTFAIDEDTFEAIPANRLPAGVLAKYFEKINDSKIFEAHELFFNAILTEESSKRFIDRLDSTDNPITTGVLGDLATWLLGDVYLQGEASAESKES